jgi:hypothetical protein
MGEGVIKMSGRIMKDICIFQELATFSILPDLQFQLYE